MNPTKKNILLIHPPHALKSAKLQHKSPLFINLAHVEITAVCHDVYNAFPIGPGFHERGHTTIYGKNTTGKFRWYPAIRSDGREDTNSFIIRMLQSIDAMKPDAVFFQLPFEQDETLFQVLGAINNKTDIPMGITRLIKENETTFQLPEKHPGPLRPGFIQWVISHVKGPMDTRPLWQLSRQGTWNHFVVDPQSISPEANGLISFILSNPNIAHSHEMYSSIPAEERVDGPDTFNLSAVDIPYSTVAPLPGIPLWKALDDPALILLYLTTYTQKELFPVRVDIDAGTVFSLGKNIQFYFQKPEDLPPGYLDEICKMVAAGGSVATKWVRYNLERAFLIAYAMEHGMIVGNSSLKHPRKPFIERINRISGMDFTHFLERGYTSVRPEYRALGVGAKLLEGLTDRAEDHKIFSIISEDNTATQKIAIRNNTRKVVTYYSEQMGKSAGIWMPESMIDR